MSEEKKIRRVKKLKGYAAQARYLAEAGWSEDPVGEIPKQIDQPYAYSPVHTLFRDSEGRTVFMVEIAQRTYEVYEVLDRSLIQDLS